MQDLFQLGSLLQRAGTASEPGRSSRRTSGQKEADEYSEIPSFDALLAIAATFADNASDQNSQNPINQNAASVVGPVQGDSESSSGSTPVDVRDLLGPFTPESSQPIGEGMNVSGIGRIDRSGIEADGTGAPGIPLGFEYRRVSRSIPVSVENVGLSRDGAMFGTDSSTTSRQVRLMDQMDDTIGEGHSLDGNLDTRAEIERLPRWRNAPMTGEPSDTGYGDDGLTGPDLQIIARNDNPMVTARPAYRAAGFPHRRQQPPGNGMAGS
ncbi:MAG: hypothetical protein R2849_19730 [Thermomicrobiales bacterium]